MTKYYLGEPKLRVSADCIILGFKNNKLQLLIGRRPVDPGKGQWSLYGGFVQETESLTDAAKRVLQMYTGIHNLYMRQVAAFGEVERDPGDRVVSIAYCALINVDDYDNRLLDKYGLLWADLDKLPPLFGDHNEMIQLALFQLRKNISTEPFGFKLLPDLFTLTQLQHVYEAILGENIDKRNFRKRIKQIDFIEKTDLIDKTSSKRGASLYRFNKKIYDIDPNFRL